MRRVLSEKAVQAYVAAPLIVQRAFDKQIKLLVENLRHPSLHAKKYDQANNIWQARINNSWRFYFIITGDSYVILNLKQHPK